MLFYLLPYLFLLFFGLLFVFSKVNFKSYGWILFFTTLPGILLVILRGDIGTDKGYYQAIIYHTVNGSFEKVNYEIGFKYLTLLIAQINTNENFIIAVVGLLTALITISAFSENRNKAILFVLVIFPYFFYDMTMNGLRYGLSFAICALAAQKIKNKKQIQFFILAILAMSIQYSSFVILFLIYLFQFRLKPISLVFLVLFVVVLYTIVDVSYLNTKADAYKELTRPSGISGLSPLIVFIILFLTNNFHQSKLSNFFYLLLLLEVGSFILSLFSYSGFNNFYTYYFYGQFSNLSSLQ